MQQGPKQVLAEILGVPAFESKMIRDATYNARRALLSPAPRPNAPAMSKAARRALKREGR